MDADIQFGDVEEAGRSVQLRPDQNRHFACVAVHAPEERDLPVYVDIDVMRDMETHAISNTNVELGGVLLGGQYEDQDGNPYVVVTDSLRAEHYEATKGSFKFTHETWQQISRQREEFPEELQMVGWYHTHPDWGVFLSGMDMFICENFFNRPLDLALVIDPCRGDRGWFHWVNGSTEKIRRCGGFFLIGSRFRQHELEHFAQRLEGIIDMAAEYGNSQIAGSIGGGAPVINVSGAKDPGTGFGVLALCAMQFLFLALIAWKIVFGGSSQSDLQELKDEITALRTNNTQQQQIDILKEALALTGDKEELLSLLEENRDLKIRLEDSTAKRLQLTESNQSLKLAADNAEAESRRLKALYEKTRNEVSTLKKKNRELASEDKESTSIWQQSGIMAVVVSIGLGCLVFGGALGFLFGRVRANPDDMDADDDPGAGNDFWAPGSNSSQESNLRPESESNPNQPE